jgi:Leucine-rich repeat (LRR) protein
LLPTIALFNPLLYAGNDVPLDLTKITTNTSLEEIQISATGLRSTMGIQNAKKTLKRLHVTDNDMSGPFPSELFELTKLVALYMSFNSFTGTLPTEIGLLSKMEEFYLFGNEIKGSIPGASIAKMSNLKEFILSNNYLTGTIPQEFSSLSLLEQLSLYDQRSASLITGTIPNFVGAPKLWYFDVSNNDMKGSIPSDFMDLSVYKDEAITIYLTNNEITGTLPVSLDLFSNMDLDITGNSITGLSGAFCDSDDDGDWMQGNVRKFGCDAILCPPGTFTKSGKQESSDVPCQPCPLLQGDLRFGQNHCDGIASEKSVLLELYRATNGAGWTNRAKWGSKEPICSWEGIKCLTGDDDEYGVTTVDLQNNTLVGTLPSSVFALPFLKQLDLKDNLGLHVSLGGLPSAQSLELLYLSNTKVDTMVGISQAPNLHEVHVTGCGLTGPMPDEIFDLAASLKGLYIAYNAFSGTLSTRIGELTKLEYFYAFDNDFSGTIPTEIGLMSKLSFFGEFKHFLLQVLTFIR